MLFCDMLRANKLNVVDKNNCKPTPFDNWLENFGGCTYINTYTPAPDTPRSLACLYTGLYPKYNGCNTRIEWPRFYQNENLETMFQYLNKNNFKVYTNFSKNEIETGICTNKDLKRIINYDSFLDFFSANNIKEDKNNQFFFIRLNDFHHCVSDYSSLPISTKIGSRKLLNTFDIFFKKYDKEIFDFTFIFSDHGCMLSNDKFYKDKDYLLLNDNRSKIFMHLRKKGDKYLRKNNSLRTIMDIYPTVVDIVKKPIDSKLDGISLFKKKGRNFVIIEDSSEFKPHLGIFNNIWRYKELGFSIYLDPDIKSINLEGGEQKSYIELKSSLNLKKVIKRVSEISISYGEIKKRKDILLRYEKMNEHYFENNFSDGTSRNSRISKFIYKLISKFFKMVFNFRKN